LPSSLGDSYQKRISGAQMRKFLSLALPLAILAALTVYSLKSADSCRNYLQSSLLQPTADSPDQALVQPWPTPDPGNFILPNNPQAFDNFGTALAYSDKTLAIGAPNTDLEGARNAGVVYLFQKNGKDWQQIARLAPEPPQPDGRFGSSLAIEGELLVVGAPYEYNPGAGNASGAVYLFRRGQSWWAQQARLSVEAGASFDLFGSALALNASELAVGARAADGPKGERDAGAVYLYHQENQDWTFQTRLGAGSAPFDHFGHALVFADDELLIGAPDADASHYPNAGQVYVFRFTHGSWTEQTRLNPNEIRPQARFGLAFSVQGGLLAVLATQEYQKDGPMPSNAFAYETSFGAAHIFERTQSGWQWQTRLFPQPSDPQDAVLVSTAVITNSGDRARLALSGYGQAGLFLFDGQGGVWKALPRIDLQNRSLVDGRGLAAVGGQYLLGDPFYDIPGPGGNVIQSAGSVWLIAAPEVSP
jgi:hypothetical protein